MRRFCLDGYYATQISTSIHKEREVELVEVQFKSIMECISSVYSDINAKEIGYVYKAVDDLISDESKSAGFIRMILQDDDFHTPYKESNLYEVAKVRARHSLITFLIGLYFCKYCGFEKKISALMGISQNECTRLWMLTALYHDYGYFLKDLNNEKADIKGGVKYYLLDDRIEDERIASLQGFSLYHKEALAYTYDEIEEYSRYIRTWHIENKHNEKVDHGILGGVRVYHRLINRILQRSPISKHELFLIKTSCLAIAQHNIFKSDSPEIDKAYGEKLKKLHSISDFVISDKTPLLFLLSLVDTFECVKRFGQCESERQYLQIKTVLSSIKLSVSPQEIIIDYHELVTKIQKRKNDMLHQMFEKYKMALLNIGTWTAFHTEEINSNIIRIKINHNIDHDAYNSDKNCASKPYLIA